MNESISLRDLYEIIRKRLFIIILIICVTTAVSGAISYYLLPKVYEATSQILINEKKTSEISNQFNDIQTNIQLINTYNVILTSPSILNKVISRLDLSYSLEELQDQIIVTSENDSQVMNITVKNRDPKLTVKIANTLADVAKEQIPRIMNINNVSILSKIDTDKVLKPVQPKLIINLSIGFVVGTLFGIGMAFLLHYLDKTIKDEKELENLLNLPFLGTIYDNGKERKKVSKRGAEDVKGEEKKYQAYS